MIIKKSIRVLFSALLVVFLLVIAVGCKKDDDPNKPGGKSTYTYNIYTAISPSNWNELTYQDNNDTQIMNYMKSNFFEFNFKFDNEGNIIDGQFEVEYAAATALKDVTADYVGDEWGIPEEAKNRAYEITLRNDLKWDDGTPIKAGDFVYTMKEQLDPLAQHYRADSYYVGATIIHNAESYVKQGQESNVSLETFMKLYELENVQDAIDKAVDEERTTYINWEYSFGYNMYDPDADIKDEVVETDKDLQTLYDDYVAEVVELGWADEAKAKNWALSELYVFYEFPAIDFKNVGIFAPDDYTLVLILDKELSLINDDGTLSYRAAYNMNSLPLVKEDIFEATKVAPSVEGGLWTSTYNSNLFTSASWGPYKLTKFQSGKEYQLEKNPNWFGYTANLYPDQYQTEIIHCETIKEWNTAFLKFLSGEIDNIGIDVSVAQDYKSSERAYYTPDDFVASLQLQSNKEALKGRESDGVNKTILSYLDFRKALSLSINRTQFASSTTTSSLAGYGLFNSMHYYDVANGGVYRNEDVAKEVLCEIYNIDPSKYDSLDEAERAITGYDIKEARRLVTKAYNDALDAGDIKEGDKVELVMGTGTLNDTVKRRFQFLQEAWKELVKETPLEDRLVFKEVEKLSTWATDFRDGAYDICMGGWTGAAWDPGYFLLAYLDPSYMYSRAWETNKQMLEFTMPGVGDGGADVTDTLSLIEWYNCLNGATDAKYNWGQGSLPEAKRLLLIAALEKEVLSVYYTVPLYNNFAASLISYKIEYKTYTYNTFMSYGGIRYMTYNHDDASWKKLVDNNKGSIDYKG